MTHDIEARPPEGLVGRCAVSVRAMRICRIVSVSDDEIEVVSSDTASPGEAARLSFHGVGDFTGRVERLTERGFVIGHAHPPEVVARLAERLADVQARRRPAGAEQRRHERVVPVATSVTVTIEGRAVAAELIDISVSGAAIAYDGERPAIGSDVIVGRTPARVVRTMPEGFAVQFAHVLPSLRAAA